MLMSPNTHRKLPFHQFWIIVAHPPVSLIVPDRPPYDVPHLSSRSDAVLPPSPETFILFQQEAEGSFTYEKGGNVMVFATAILFKPTIADIQSAFREYSYKPSRMFRTNETPPPTGCDQYISE